MPCMSPADPSEAVFFFWPGPERAIAELKIGDFSRAKALFSATGFKESDFATTGAFCFEAGFAGA